MIIIALNKHTWNTYQVYNIKRWALTSDCVTEVVHYDRLEASLNQLHHTVTADVAGSSCDQHLLSHALQKYKPLSSFTETFSTNLHLQDNNTASTLTAFLISFKFKLLK